MSKISDVWLAYEKLRAAEKTKNLLKLALVFCLLIIVPLAMTAVDQYRERQRLERELNQRKAVACPKELKGRALTFAAYAERNIFIPKAATLTCYYKRSM